VGNSTLTVDVTIWYQSVTVKLYFFKFFFTDVNVLCDFMSIVPSKQMRVCGLH